jgi:hypothetical protein
VRDETCAAALREWESGKPLRHLAALAGAFFVLQLIAGIAVTQEKFAMRCKTIRKKNQVLTAIEENF